MRSSSLKVRSGGEVSGLFIAGERPHSKAVVEKISPTMAVELAHSRSAEHSKAGGGAQGGR